MTSFLNPYHFLPLPENWDAVKNGYLDRAKATAVLKDLATDAVAAHLRHDQFGPGLLSGRILCRLTTASPCVFGNKHEPYQTWSAKVHNYELDGKPAIASTQLRGLISTIAEAASGSSMRVLTNQGLSYRSEPRDSAQLRSAIGMILREGAHRWLLPLTFPRLELRTAADHVRFKILDAPDPWRALCTQLLGPGSRSGAVPLSLGVYLGEYGTNLSKKNQKRLPHRLEKPQGVLSKQFDGRTFPSHCHKHFLQLWKLKAPDVSFQLELDAEQPAIVPLHKGAPLHMVNRNQFFHFASRGPFPLTLRLEPSDQNRLEPISEDEDLQSLIDQAWRIGIIRRLARPRDRDKNLFVLGDKKHELFIPIEHHLDIQTRRLKEYGPSLLDVELACRAFENNANTLRDINKDERPFRLAGQPFGPVKLRHGDLVHFRLAKELAEDREAKTLKPMVDSLAISSIWREDAGALFEHLKRLGLAELLPFGQARETLSPADRLFGFVEQGEARDSTQDPRRGGLKAYASRVRFSAARLNENQTPPNGGFYLDQGKIKVRGSQGQMEGWYPLKILSSPKPPCPEFYFQRVDENQVEVRVNRSDVHPGGIPRPQGCKTYLHDPRAMNLETESVASEGGRRNKYTWETEDAKNDQDRRNQKMLIRPLRKDVTFYFHIDFYNLKRDELGLILYALQPSVGFHHKLGLAKPLGLGSVRIDPLGVFTTSKERRYRDTKALLASAANPGARYDQVATSMSPEQRNTACEDLPARYRREAEALRDAKYPGTLRGWDPRLGAFTPQGPVASALNLLGDPQKVKALTDSCPGLVVQYPHSSETNSETELFKWHVEHRKAGPSGSFLKPLPVSGLVDLVLKQRPSDPDPCRGHEPGGNS